MRTWIIQQMDMKTDTLDKVDPAALRQNVAAWAAMLSIVANVEEPLGPVTR